LLLNIIIALIATEVLAAPCISCDFHCFGGLVFADFVMLWNLLQLYGAPKGTCIWNILCRAHDLLTRAHEIRTRAHDLLTRSHDLLSCAHEIGSRAHDLIW